jgi:type IV pilus assembly protein PilC
MARFTKRISTKDKVIFARQLSTLINAGLPLTQSLRTVSEQSSNDAMKVIIQAIITDVEGGKSLSASFARYPKVFNNVFVSLVAAGETSGTLDRSLDRIATQQEKDAEIMAKVRGAMVYPVIVLVVIVGVLVFMMITVIRRLSSYIVISSKRYRLLRRYSLQRHTLSGIFGGS